MLLKICYYLLVGIILRIVTSQNNSASQNDIKSVRNESLQHLGTTVTELNGLVSEGAIAVSRSKLSSADVRPTAFTNRIGGSKSIDVSWLFPDREDLENGILRISNDIDFEETMERLKKFSKNSIDEIVRSASPHLFRTFYGLEISPDCMSSALDLFDGVRNLKEWAIRMLDSNGFYPGSLMDGTLFSIGNYDMCINTKASSDSDGDLFIGQYCSIHIRSSFPSSSPSHPSPSWQFVVHPEETDHLMDFPTWKWKRLQKILFYQLGVCFPSTCTKQDVQTVFDEISQFSGILNITVQRCEVKENLAEKMDAQLIAWICLLGLAVGFVLICTWVDIAYYKVKEKCSFLEETNKEKNRNAIKVLPLTICESFSFVRNAKKLTSEKSDDKLKFLHGIRVFSMAWIILGNCYVADPRLLGSATKQFGILGRSVWFQLISNAPFAVDTFFLMSGFLVAYLCLGRMHQRKGRFNYIAFYVNRIFRLTPPYLFAIGIYVLVTSLGNGPVWHEAMQSYFLDKCKETWWKNLLYINNFFSKENSCGGHFWYLGVSMQLFLISLPIVSLLYKKPSLGMSVLLLLMLFCMALNGILIFLWDLPPSLLLRPFFFYNYAEFSLYGYVLPHHHGGPYFLGMALGYFLHRKGEMKVNPVVKCLGWIASSGICLSVIYGIYPWNRGDNFPQEWVAIYAAFSRTAWGVGIAWIFFICFTGNGGLVNFFLSSKHFIPISRLTYCVYLIHYIFIALFRAHSRSVEYFSHLKVVYLFSSVMFLSHLSAILFTLFFECPSIALLKCLQSKERSDGGRGESMEVGQKEEDQRCGKNAIRSFTKM